MTQTAVPEAATDSAMPAQQPATHPGGHLATPSVRRRLMVMVYEAFLLLAVEMLAVLLYMLVTGNRQEPIYRGGRTLFLFLVAGAYFVRCWTDSGHTLAMKTWRVRLSGGLSSNGAGHTRIPLRTAMLRYLLAWGWFAPALIVRAAFGLHGKGETAAVIAAGIAAWAMTAFLDKDRQFLHDRLAGTRLVQMPKKLTAPAAS
jgi:uncharacterized RDD family membrane protein YckC